MYSEANDTEGNKMIPAIESKIERLAAMLEEAIERGDEAHAEELNYELDELYNQAEEDCGI